MQLTKIVQDRCNEFCIMFKFWRKGEGKNVLLQVTDLFMIVNSNQSSLALTSSYTQRVEFRSTINIYKLRLSFVIIVIKNEKKIYCIKD